MDLRLGGRRGPDAWEMAFHWIKKLKNAWDENHKAPVDREDESWAVLGLLLA